MEGASKYAPYGNTECFKKIFIKATENERRNGQSVAVKMWDDTVKRLKSEPESGRRELQKTVEEMSSVQYVISFESSSMSFATTHIILCLSLCQYAMLISSKQ